MRTKIGEAVPARRAIRALTMVIVAASLLLACVWQAHALAAEPPAPNTPTQERKVALKQLKDFARKNPKDFPNYVTSLALGLDGSVWVAAEDGLWRYQPDGTRTRYTTADGLGDQSIYALAVDKLGRVWVGHLNHGVSVFNGQKWQNYEVVAGLSREGTLAGPIGERVFRIAVNPADGDVWMATNAGLARYSQQNNDWSYYTRAQSLPSDQANAIAFDPEGNIYVGTQCDGIAMADAADNYQNWRTVRGPDKMPTVSRGDGLPTNLINDLLVARDGKVYAATTTGLAISEDKGKTWTFVRGKDWAAKVQGRLGGAPQGFKDDGGGVLNEDYITCLAEDREGKEGDSGLLYLGHWHEGYEVFDPFLHSVVTSYEGDGFIKALLPLAGEKEPMLGTYAERPVLPPLTMLATSDQSAAATPVAAEPRPLPFPAGAKALNEQQLMELAAQLRSIPAAASNSGGAGGPVVAVLPDDWKAQGSWLGRYGRYWCTTTAQDYDYMWGVGEQPVGYVPRIGLQCNPGDSLRFWIHEAQSTNDVRALEMPPVYLHSRVLRGEADFASRYRRQAEHDDHGETYPMTNEGPGLYYSLTIPSGTYSLSFYCDNKDGHEGINRLRDYRFSVRPFAGQADKLVPADPERVSRRERINLVNLDGFDQRPEFAHARLLDFWHGNYKRFVVRGPAALTVEVARNGSVNAINAGIFLDDLLDEYPKAYYPVGPVSSTLSSAEATPPASSAPTGAPRLSPGSAVLGATLGTPATNASAVGPVTPPAVSSPSPTAVITEMHRLLQRNPAAWAQHHQAYIQVLRSISPESQISNLKSQIRSALASAAYHTSHFPLWEQALHALGLKTTREIEKSLRWDGKTFACTGKERQILAQQRAESVSAGHPPPATQEARP